jgi:hypothetical protein
MLISLTKPKGAHNVVFSVIFDAYTVKNLIDCPTIPEFMMPFLEMLNSNQEERAYSFSFLWEVMLVVLEHTASPSNSNTTKDDGKKTKPSGEFVERSLLKNQVFMTMISTHAMGGAADTTAQRGSHEGDGTGKHSEFQLT